MWHQIPDPRRFERGLFRRDHGVWSFSHPCMTALPSPAPIPPVETPKLPPPPTVTASGRRDGPHLSRCRLQVSGRTSQVSGLRAHITHRKSQQNRRLDSWMSSLFYDFLEFFNET